MLNFVKKLFSKNQPKSNDVLSNVRSRKYTFYRINRTQVIYNGNHLELIETKFGIIYFDYINNIKYCRKFIENL